MEGQPEVLSLSVGDDVKARAVFGNPNVSPAMREKMEKQLKGSAGTLHVTKQEDTHKVIDLAWQLSSQTKLPVVVVVRGN